MSLDFVVRSCTRRCATSGRPLTAGEPYYSVLVEEEDEVVRHDIAAEAWQGPPEDHLGWWRARLADRHSGKPRLAPGEVLLGLLDRWANEPGQLESRYVLSLLLIRRRMLRMEQASFAAGLHGGEPISNKTATGEREPEVLRLYCPQNDKSYEIACAKPSTEQVTVIQERLSQLLFSDAA